MQLARRFESEGRSHAFNSLIEADGSGVMGLPTIRGESGRSRAPWRSSASDLSFLAVDARGRLRPVGELERRFDYGDDDEADDDGIAGYQLRGLLHRLVRQFAADLHRRPDLRR